MININSKLPTKKEKKKGTDELLGIMSMVENVGKKFV